MQNKKMMFCDPGVCDYCLYIGEGDFVCDKTQEIVVSDWRPTDYYLTCKQKNKENYNV